MDDRLPGSAWVFYPTSILALTLLISIVLWVDRSVPFGSYGSFQGIFPPFVFYFLALYGIPEVKRRGFSGQQDVMLPTSHNDYETRDSA
jgi:hypothetical protein